MPKNNVAIHKRKVILMVFLTFLINLLKTKNIPVINARSPARIWIITTRLVRAVILYIIDLKLFINEKPIHKKDSIHRNTTMSAIL